MSILLGKLAIFLSRTIGHQGTDVGGRIALRFNKKILQKLLKNIETIILVTGTNGKSTTTNVICSGLEEVDPLTVSNKKGANMHTGILSALVESYRFFGNKKIKYGVFEVDEGSVPKVMAELDKCYLVITNFFRDQLDRYGEIDILINKIQDSLKDKQVKLVINVDDPFSFRFNKFDYVGYGLDSSIDIFEKGSISDSRYCPNCGLPLIYTTNFYGQLGYYSCECGYNRPVPKYCLTKIKANSVEINNHEYQHNLKGAYNAYNILAALGLLKELGVGDEKIQAGLNNCYSTGGRMQLLKIAGNDVYLNLVKNHTGMNMTIQEVKKIKPNHIAFILNDFDGDGNDISWIWDADIENLVAMNIERFFVSGTRANDMALRLKNIGIPKDKIVVNSLFNSLIELVTNKNAVIFSSYTALNEVKIALEKMEDK